MKDGARQYADVVQHLATLGIGARFTQTGGMNAAIEAHLDGGAHLLITDAEDSLPWSRADHRGWGVGLYPSEESQDQLAYEATEDSGLAALTDVVRLVLTLAASPDS